MGRMQRKQAETCEVHQSHDGACQSPSKQILTWIFNVTTRCSKQRNGQYDFDRSRRGSIDCFCRSILLFGWSNEVDCSCRCDPWLDAERRTRRPPNRILNRANGLRSPPRSCLWAGLGPSSWRETASPNDLSCHGKPAAGSPRRLLFQTARCGPGHDRIGFPSCARPGATAAR